MTFTDDEIENIKKAGEIHKEIVGYAKGLIKPGVRLLEIAEKIDARVLELGARLAFPVNLSVDEVAAHATPAWNSEEVARGLLKVDIGIHIEGFVADGAFSLDLSEEGSEASVENKKIIEAAESGLKSALDVFREGVSLGEVGKAIQKAISEKGFTAVQNLCGHEIKQYDLHAGMTIPNVDNGSNIKIGEGLYAIEPFATKGLGKVRDGKPSGIYQLRVHQTSGVRDNFARKVLDFIAEEYQTLPFCSRWIYNEFGSRGILALRMIEQSGVVHQYNQLVEAGNGKVAQAEHTVLISKKGRIVTTAIA